jgi:sulfatase modifying factor 1
MPTLKMLAAILLSGCTAKTNTDTQDTQDTQDTVDEDQAMAFVAMAGGTFTMGADTTSVSGADTASAPAHSVTISDYELGETEVTSAQYLSFLSDADAEGLLSMEEKTENWPDGSTVTHTWVYGASDSPWPDQPLIELSDAGGVSSVGDVEHADNRCWIAYDTSAGFSLVDEAMADWPVTWVKWYGAAAFAEHGGWSLPSEAQWEHAARCGSDAEFATASGTADPDEANWNGDTPNQANHEGHVLAVKSFAPSGCGLYEMSGNAWEWVEDWYGGAPFYEETDGRTDPLNTDGVDPDSAEGAAAWVEGEPSTFRVRRGGSWNYHTATITTWGRAYDFPQRGNNHFGFRVAR